ncbi:MULTISPECIES: aminotransferase class I/II-fold pyridoxal phosphate-dependent enzyme [unclassified Lactobacillus]|uniref:aminotransferase class I/II-fold pyridoxal phosphate-dependent enzyme n=1 Tax=unclassified Lactobacillus TaxID=2620435 RepID=UPI000EFC26ED|nr:MULTISPECIES: aminotransferase class I/II-fold pyridoxal phosphate-dependent enzyme [unclassified Lactobacillus]RMC40001.1 aminotransferase class I/II-fold pyridoxal phosphate-dependent enzyme [Lactobacillus sp. ESL0237]RMC44162.1 aminotransferase class I/II-fold pyridoxal phosphate-dependent enzyme [Lactobacillus sp. ESL0234]RMC45490.1 aminotransferase class I/II-fold pyridoxal phosphate-dependent enzyme [Lactobacillus sp. ESL0236]RMC46452.1 aminotransferase class I/II-fold pyridoxal phosph
MPTLANNLSDTINKRIEKLPKSEIRSFSQKISQIPGIVKLTVGEPDLNTPDHIKQAAIDDINRDDSHYAPEAGKEEYLNAVSDYLKKSLGVYYNPKNEICATVGVSAALNVSFMAILNPGDKVIVPTPVWGVYFGIIKMAGGVPIEVDTSADNFILTAAHLAKVMENEGKGAKAVILTDPSNPTGRVYAKKDLKELAKVIVDYNLFALSDEIYAELIYAQKKHYSLTQIIPDRTILLSGLSKNFAMTGWRIGYIAAPKEIMQTISKINSFMITSVTDNVQIGAAEAISHGEQDYIEARAIYERRLHIIQTGLEKNGFTMATPEGAFYIFAKIPSKFGTDDVAFATDLANKVKVGVIPGSYFGAGGQGFVRLSYASSEKCLRTAVERITTYVNEQL